MHVIHRLTRTAEKGVREHTNAQLTEVITIAQNRYFVQLNKDLNRRQNPLPSI